MSSLMLVGAVFAALALGVLLAYGICHGFFRLLRMQAMSAAKVRGQVPVVSVARES